MKRLCLIMCALLLVVSLAACNRQTDLAGDTSQSETLNPDPSATDTLSADPNVFVFPKDSLVYQIRLDGLTEEDAWKTLVKTVDSFVLDASAKGKTAQIKGSEFKLSASEKAFQNYCQDVKAGKTVSGNDIVTYDLASAVKSVIKALAGYASDADIRYDDTKKKFVPVPGQDGIGIEEKDAEKLIADALASGSKKVNLDKVSYSWKPDVSVDDAKVKNALSEANSYLRASLVYTFTPDGGSTSRHTIPKAKIAEFISIDDNYEVGLNSKAISEYVAELAEKYCVPGHEGNFRTTGGSTLDYTVEYYGQGVDQSALVSDLEYCMKSGISGIRPAPYHDKDATMELPYGGNYIEVSLSDQHVWVYREGSCVVGTDVVSGCVADGNMTPNGIYSVQELDRDCWLTGATWDTHVDYWVGFYGGYGLHDAPWRDQFGGDNYIYGGSHGCVNLPVGSAGNVYENAYLGMKVIVYGGKQHADPLKQEIYGKDSYKAADDAKPFRLDVSLKYEDAELSFRSSNESVAKVSRDGTVTVQGVGDATITVTAKAFTHHTSAERKITIHVTSACDEGRHAFGPWKQTKAPTCVPGEETRTCSKCGKVETRAVPATQPHTPGEWVVEQAPGCETPGKRVTTCKICGAKIEEEIPAIGHKFSPDHEFCENGCGTPNPDYVPPETETPPDPTDSPDPTESPDPSDPADSAEPGVQAESPRRQKLERYFLRLRADQIRFLSGFRKF